MIIFEVRIGLSWQGLVLMIVFIVALALSIYYTIKNRRSQKKMDRLIDRLMDHPEEIPALTARLQESCWTYTFSQPKTPEWMINFLQSDKLVSYTQDRFGTYWIKRTDSDSILFFAKYGRLNDAMQSQAVPVVDRYELEPLLFVFSPDRLTVELRGDASASNDLKGSRAYLAMVLDGYAGFRK